MKESSSYQSTQQSPPRPSSTLTSSNLEYSQVDLIARTLSTASTLGRVRRDSLAIRDPPETRQVLERTLKRNLNRRLTEISLVNSNQELSQLSNPSQLLGTPLERFPRTSSPFEQSPTLAPRTPISPSTSFNSVFFPDTPDLPNPIQPPDLVLPELTTETRPVSPTPSCSLVNSNMSGLEQKENSLKNLCRRITAKMDANPINILTMLEMTPLFQEEEKKLVTLLEDLSVEAQEIFEDHAVELGDNKITAWKSKIHTVKSNLFQYRQNLAIEVKKLKAADAQVGGQSSNSLSQTIPINSSTNSNLEQDRLDLEKQKQQRLEDKIRTEAESRLKAVVDDAKRFAVKFPPMAESWTVEENVKIEMAMKEINHWEKQMNDIVKESREVEILVKGNSLADPDDNLGKMKHEVAKTQKLMDNTINQVKQLDESRKQNYIE